MKFEKELQAALEATRRASEHIHKAYKTFEPIPNARASITTEVDLQSQEIILGSLREKFPDDAFCAEETTESMDEVSTSGKRMWIIDPIDGTRGFAMKNDEFSVMVGFVDESGVAVGVVQEPAKKRITYAARGAGCWAIDGLDGSPVQCRVTDQDQLAECTLTTSRPKPGKRSPVVEAIQPKKLRPTYSAGIKLALVARGEADLYVNDYPAFHDWDICAGHILVLEAGGNVTDGQGDEIHYGSTGFWQRRGLLATNAALHESSLAVLGRK